LRENECYATTINGLELHYLGPSLEKAAEELAQDYYVFREETPELIVQVERGDGRRGRFVVRIEIVQKVTVAEIPEYGATGSALPRRVLEALELASEALEDITVVTGLDGGDKARQIASPALAAVQRVIADMS